MRIEIKHIEETFKALENIDKERVNQAIKNITQDVYENVRFYAKPHHKTGTLERNIKHKVKKEAGIVGIADSNMLVEWKGRKVNYANFVLFGTRQHLIKAKNKKALRFSYKNLDEFVYRKSVHHPGYRGDDFLKKALQKTLSNLDKLMKG